MKEIGKIICRILSIYLLCKAILFIPSVVTFITYGNPGNSAFSLFLNVAVYLIFIAILLCAAIGFWIFADYLSRFFGGTQELPKDFINLNYEKIQAVAFVIIGVATLANAIPEFVNVFVNFSRSIGLDFKTSQSSILNFAAPVLKALLGVCLILFSSVLSKFSDKLNPFKKPETKE